VHILRVDSYTGDDTSRDQHEILDEEGLEFKEISALFVIVIFTAEGAEIIDDGYRSMAEAQKAWPEAIPRSVTPPRSRTTCKTRRSQSTKLA
jgi:hypothetical protein